MLKGLGSSNPPLPAAQSIELPGCIRWSLLISLNFFASGLDYLGRVA